MLDRIPTDIVKIRSKELTEICSNLSVQKNTTHIGKNYQILITEMGKNNTMMGRTDSYKPVVITEKVSIGDIVEVGIIDAKQTYLFGTIK